jgi:hypothetical protein
MLNAQISVQILVNKKLIYLQISQSFNVWRPITRLAFNYLMVL